MDAWIISLRVSQECNSCACSLKIFVGDTVLHSWEVLAKILANDIVKDIMCDIGMLAVQLYLAEQSTYCVSSALQASGAQERHL